MKLAVTGFCCVLAAGSANASRIFEMPDTATFDLVNDRSSYVLDAKYNLDDEDPGTSLYFLENFYSLTSVDPPDSFYASISGFEDINEGLQALLFGRQFDDGDGNIVTKEDGKFDALMAGMTYDFFGSTLSFLYDPTNCSTLGIPETCSQIPGGGSVQDTTRITFAPEIGASEVPEAPTSILLATALAGILVRKRLR